MLFPDPRSTAPIDGTAVARDSQHSRKKCSRQGRPFLYFLSFGRDQKKGRRGAGRSARGLLFLLFAILPIVLSENSLAAETWDSILDGFEESANVAAENQESADTSALASPTFRLGGWAKLGATWNFAHEAPQEGETDWRGLSRLRPELQLEAGLRLPRSWRLFASGKGFYDFAYAVNGRDDYTAAVLDEYEREVELRETFAAGPLTDWLDVKLGRQIVVWGRSDNVRLTDLLNPLDLREPGLTDIEDLRLPVTMARADAHAGPWTLTGIVLPEIRFDKRPVFGHDFFPADGPLPPEEVPSDGFRNPEYAAALTGTFPGWDLSLYWADIYDDLPHLQEDSGRTLLQHSRLHMLGIAGSRALGNFLLLGEAAWFDGLEFFGATGKFSRSDFLAGVEYAGFRNTAISLEAVYRHMNGHKRQLALPPDEVTEETWETVLRLSRSFWRERLNLTLLTFAFGATGNDGALQRLQGTYELGEGVNLATGVVLFQSGDLPAFRAVGDNDRAFAEVKWDF